MLLNRYLHWLLLGLAVMIAAAPAEAQTLVTDNPGTIIAIVVDSTDPNIVYAAANEAGVLKSIDNGATWTTKNSGLTPTTINGRAVFIVNGLAIDPTTPANLYLTANTGAYKSIDGGETWTAMVLSTEFVLPTTVAVYDEAPNNVFVGTGAAGLFGSTDYGTTWVALGGQDYGQVNGLAITGQEVQSVSIRRDGLPKMDPSMESFFAPSLVYVVTTQGVYRLAQREDGEDIWLPAGLSNQYIYSVLGSKLKKELFGKKQPVVYVGLHELGIFTSLDGEAWTHLDTPGGDLGIANINAMTDDLIPSPQPDDLSTAETGEIADLHVLYIASWDGFLKKAVNDNDVLTWTTLLNADILNVSEVHPRSVALAHTDATESTPAAVALWVGTFGFGLTDAPIKGTIYHSPDGGITWTDTLAPGYYVNN